MKKCIFKVLAIMLVLACLAAVGCGKKNNNSNNSNNGSDPAPTQRADAANSQEPYAKLTPNPNMSTIGGDLHPYGQDTYVIKSEDCFEEYGFTFFIAGSDCEYNVEMESDKGAVEWAIYLLDDKYPDALRYMLQSEEPALKESGSLTVEKGQYVYVYCSVNSFTAESAHEGAAITFTGAGLPKE